MSFPLSEIEIPELLITTSPKSQLALYRKLSTTPRLSSQTTTHLLTLTMSQRSPPYALALSRCPPSVLSALGDLIPHALNSILGYDAPPISNKHWKLLHEHLGIPYETLPKGRKRRFREGELQELVEGRDMACPLTHKVTATYASRIINSAASSVTSRDHSAYWVLLRLILGDDVADYVWSIVGTEREDVTNGILLEAWSHQTWQEGSFQLVPVETGALEGKGGFLDLEVRLVEDLEWGEFVTAVPREVERQWGRKRKRVVRMVEEGDRFRVVTRDGERWGLPSPGLLYVRAVLMQFVREAGGLGEGRRRKRVRKARDVFGEGEEDESDEEEEEGGNGKENGEKEGEETQDENSGGKEEGEGNDDGGGQGSNVDKITFSQFFPPEGIRLGEPEEPDTE